MLRPDGSNMGVLGEFVPKVKDGVLNEGAESAALHPGLAIDPRDLLLEKPRFGAFHGTDLELILRKRGIDTIIISGISTAVCCDTTAREANARDFRVLFLSDGTATSGSEADQSQKTTLEILSGVFAQVSTRCCRRSVVAHVQRGSETSNRELPGVQAVARQVNARFDEMGLRYCAH